MRRRLPPSWQCLPLQAPAQKLGVRRLCHHQSETQQKKIIFHPKFLPTVVICDPELTVGMPTFITAGTGLDMPLLICVEAFSSPHYHPMSQGMALEGMRLIKEYLPRAIADGTNIEARAHMMSAAIMGATGFQKGLGAIHALSHPIGAMYHTITALPMRSACQPCCSSPTRNPRRDTKRFQLPRHIRWV